MQGDAQNDNFWPQSPHANSTSACLFRRNEKIPLKVNAGRRSRRHVLMLFVQKSSTREPHKCVFFLRNENIPLELKTGRRSKRTFLGRRMCRSPNLGLAQCRIGRPIVRYRTIGSAYCTGPYNRDLNRDLNCAIVSIARWHNLGPYCTVLLYGHRTIVYGLHDGTI